MTTSGLPSREHADIRYLAEVSPDVVLQLIAVIRALREREAEEAAAAAHIEREMAQRMAEAFGDRKLSIDDADEVASVLTQVLVEVPEEDRTV